MEDYVNKIKHLLNCEGISSHKLTKSIDVNFRAKEALNAMLGLNEANDWTIDFPLPTLPENRPIAVDFLLDIEKLSEGMYRYLDLSFMWQGKNKVRVGKIIPLVWDRYVKIASGDADHRFSSFDKMLQDSGVHIRGDKDRMCHLLSCYYGDYIKNGRVGHISTHPYHFFTLSGYDCTFVSCVRIGGEHFNTVLNYLASDCVAVCFITEEGGTKKIGRAIAYINQHMIATGRMYGSFFDCDALEMRDKLHGIVGGEWVVKGSVDSSFLHNRSSSFIDYGEGTVTMRKGATFDYNDHKFIIKAGYCLECGDDIDGCEDGGVCSDCSSDRMYCSRCDERITRDHEHYVLNGDAPYCEGCFDEVAAPCEYCNDWFYRADMRYVDGEYHCIYCSDNNRDFYCDYCNEWYRDGLAVYIKDRDIYVCSDCAEKRYYLCDKCGDHIEKPIEINGKDYCTECAEERMNEHGNDTDASVAECLQSIQ